MNAQEGITLAKMAIVAMMVTLVIGACFTIWYISYEPATKVQRDMEKAALSASASKLYDLQEQSMVADKQREIHDQIQAHPLVSTVTNCLSEFNEDSLLYVYIVPDYGVDAAGDKILGQPAMYTYPTVDIVDLGGTDKDSAGSGLPGIGTLGDNKFNTSSVPVTQACKYLLQYTQYRCHLTIYDAKYQDDGNNYIGLCIEIIVDDY